MKNVCIRSYSGRCFSAFGLNTETYSVSHRIQSKCGKIRTIITPVAYGYYFSKRPFCFFWWPTIVHVQHQNVNKRRDLWNSCSRFTFIKYFMSLSNNNYSRNNYHRRNRCQPHVTLFTHLSIFNQCSTSIPPENICGFFNSVLKFIFLLDPKFSCFWVAGPVQCCPEKAILIQIRSNFRRIRHLRTSRYFRVSKLRY